jgi:hypothetical protein
MNTQSRLNLHVGSWSPRRYGRRRPCALLSQVSRPRSVPWSRVADPRHERILENPRRALAPVLREHLLGLGLAVFYDERDIEELDDIEKRIPAGIAAANILVSWYSHAYASRRAHIRHFSRDRLRIRVFSTLASVALIADTP